MIRINLLPVKQLQAEVTRRRELIIGSAVLGLLALLLLGMYLYRSHQLAQLESELAGLRTEIQVLNARVKEVADLQAKIKDLRGKQMIIDDLKKKQTGPVLVLASLSRATPASLWLTDLRESGGNLTMNGLAADNETVANFMRSLATSKHFTHIELVETTQDVGPATRRKKFAIRARVIYRAPDAQPPDAKSKSDTTPKKEGKKS